MEGSKAGASGEGMNGREEGMKRGGVRDDRRERERMGVKER